MKLTMEVDCTPEEARRFFGLPDVQHMNEEIMNKFITAFQEGQLNMMNPETLMKLWMPFGPRGIEEFQNLMRKAMGQATFGESSSSKKR